MPCPPQVPISIIPPVSQGVAPILWQNGSQITRLNIPTNPSFLFYTGSTTQWVNGSAQNPVVLPSLAATTSYANDSAAASGGVKVGQIYRNGSVLQIRVS